MVQEMYVCSYVRTHVPGVIQEFKLAMTSTVEHIKKSFRTVQYFYHILTVL